jgi:hypothetical protein
MRAEKIMAERSERDVGRTGLLNRENYLAQINLSFFSLGIEIDSV